MGVRVLQLVVFLACIIGLPPLLYIILDITAPTLELEMTICMISWAVAIFLNWAIGKALEGPPRSSYDQGYTYPAQGQPYSQPPPTAYQQPGQTGYPQGHGGGSAPYRGREYEPGVREPNIYTGQTVIRRTSRPMAEESLFREHICSDCGGPINIKTKKCEYCGKRKW